MNPRTRTLARRAVAGADLGTTTTTPPPVTAPPPVTTRRRGRSPQRQEVAVTGSTTALRIALRRGLTLRLTGLQAGPTVVRVRDGRRLLARRTVRASAGGVARLALRFSPKQRRSLRGRRRVTLKVTVGTTTRTVALR